MTRPVPAVDPRTYADLVADTERLARLLSPWRPAAEGGDLGQTLIALFAGMAEQVLRRVNAVPDRDFLAFLELLGVDPLPPRAARTPLTFSPPAGSTAPGFVPAGTPVATSGDAGPTARFYTDRDLVVTPAVLAAAVVLEPAADRTADVTGPATGAPDLPWPAFAGDSLVEHALYVAHDELTTLPGPRELGVRIGLPDAPARDAFAQLPLEWATWDGARWQPLTPAAPVVDGAGVLVGLGGAAPGPLAVAGRTARWIRARLDRAIDTAPEAAQLRIGRVAVTAAVAAASASPGAAFAGAVPADLSRDVYPFGEQPRLGNDFTIGSDVLGRVGAEVTLDVTVSTGLPVVPQASPGLVLVWEVGGTDGWVPVGRSGGGAKASPGFSDGTDGLTTDGQIRFVVPTTGDRLPLNGTANWWLRVRIAAGDYGRPASYLSAPTGGSPVFVPASFAPPGLAGLRIRWTFRGEEPAWVAIGNGDAVADVTGADAPVQPFVPVPDDRPALHLGFDRPFPNRPVLLHVQVEPAPFDPGAAAPASPEARWEYAGPGGWLPLGAADETRGLTRSAPVAFLGPADLVPTARFGRSLCWLRVSPADPGTPAASPMLRRVLLNTVPASAAVPAAVEVLGAADGTGGARFRTTRAPVLAGEAVEVMAADAWQTWQRVPDFASSGPLDRHYVLDRQTGEVTFGDGRHGAAPAAGSSIRTGYRSGGGSGDNRPPGALTQLEVALAGVDSVVNLEPAAGGADPEPLSRVRLRGPVVLRHGGRAVAAEDYADLAVAASPDVARARAVPVPVNPLDVAWIQPHPVAPGPPPADTASLLCTAPDADVATHRPPSAGRVAVVVVPDTPDPRPVPSRQLLDEVAAELQPRCPAVLAAADVPVIGPEWIRVTVTATVAATDLDVARTLADAVAAALDTFLHPLHGGPDGSGWAFGRAPHRSDLLAVVSAVAGVDSVPRLAVQEDRPRGGLTGEQLARTLVWSGPHAVTVVAPGGVA